MHERVLIERNARAQARIISAAQQIGQALGLLEPANTLAAIQNRDPQILVMMQREAIADLLEGVIVKMNSQESKVAESKTALPDAPAELARKKGK